ncbi:MAG: ACP S-malonyltransferase [Actinobacteria bacterium]|nr:ACP S-malonyltransferase [Actinomycetota bacterium]
MSKIKKILLMFPGQGSQYAGMGYDFLNRNSDYLKYFDISSKIAGHELLDIITNKNGEGNLLEQTRYSQVSIFTLSCAFNDFLFKNTIDNSKKDHIISVIGHSLGDYSAIYCCRMLEFEKSAKLVSYRGNIMNEAGINMNGMMAAILGSDLALISDVLKKYKNKVFIANLNEYAQTVISGYKDDVLKAAEDLKNAGIRKIIPLKVGVASHCPLMIDVSRQLDSFIKDDIEIFNAPKLDYFSATRVSYIDEIKIREVLVEQLVNPVKWLESIEFMLENNYEYFIEVGPGKVLSGLVKKIASRSGKNEIKVFSTDSLEEIENLKNFFSTEGIINGS